jgi:uroporphyrinogen decarboxylase
VYLTPEIYKALVEHFGTDDILPILGVDFRHVGPRYAGPPRKVPEGCEHVDEWGTGYKTIQFETGGYSEASYLPFAAMTTLEEVEAHPWPKLEDYDFSDLEAQCDALSEFAVCLGDAGTPDILNGVSRGRGMERVVMDIVTEDPAGVAVIDHRCETLYQRCRRALEAGNGKIDILCLGEDCGNQAGPMFPPDVFNRFFRPRLKRFYDLAHEFGAKAMMHSCGNTRKLMPTFIEMGLDVLDAMQPEPPGMVAGEIKAEFGARLVFCGLISTQKTLPFGTEEECRKEARHRLEVVGKGGGYFFSPAHCIQSDTPLENVLAIYEEALGLERNALKNRKAK